MSTRNEELAKGLAELQRNMSHIMRHVTNIQELVPVIEFGTMIDRAEDSDVRSFEALTASPPTASFPYQIPMFEYEQPITIVFENVVINGESVDLEEMENVNGSDS